MPIILSNNIPSPEKRARFETAVLEGMGKLPSSWTASIVETQETGLYVEVRIEGPETFKWTRRFTGPSEQDAGFVKTTIRNGLLPFLTKK